MIIYIIFLSYGSSCNNYCPCKNAYCSTRNLQHDWETLTIKFKNRTNCCRRRLDDLLDIIYYRLELNCMQAHDAIVTKDWNAAHDPQVKRFIELYQQRCKWIRGGPLNYINRGVSGSGGSGLWLIHIILYWSTSSCQGFSVDFPEVDLSMAWYHCHGTPCGLLIWWIVRMPRIKGDCQTKCVLFITVIKAGVNRRPILLIEIT